MIFTRVALLLAVSGFLAPFGGAPAWAEANSAMSQVSTTRLKKPPKTDPQRQEIFVRWGNMKNGSQGTQQRALPSGKGKGN